MDWAEENSLKIIREAITGQEEYFSPDTDWSALEQELNNQALLPIAYNVLKRGCVPEGEFRDIWIGFIIQHISGWYRTLEVQNELVQILTESGYKFVIMKGFANATLFPKPEIRSTGDVDFLVKVEEFDEIYQLLQTKGFKPTGEGDAGKHHMNLKKNDVLFEMHKRPAGTMRKKSKDNQKVIDYFKEGLGHTDIVELCGYKFPIFDPVRNGLMLLMHTAGHMQGGLGIRHLLDWGMYADKYLTDTFWNDEFRQAAAIIHVDELALSMTSICQKELGLCKDRSWCMEADEDTCYALLEYMLNQGNFGRKAGEADAGAKFFTESMDTGGLFRRLDRSASYSMPIIKKYPILRPVGWVYQMGRYIKRGLDRERTYGNLHNDMETGKQRRKLMENLGIESWLKTDKK